LHCARSDGLLMGMNWRSEVFGRGRILFAVLVTSGCRQMVVPADTAGSSFAFVDGPEAAAVRAPMAAEEVRSGDYFTDARPIEPLAMPVYPARALAAKAGRTMIGVRITVDATGRVSDVGPSILAVSIPTRFDEDFQAAVRAAVRQWRFRPAQSYHVEVTKTAGGEPDIQVTRRENAETYFDVSFTFTAAGTVLGGAPGK